MTIIRFKQPQHVKEDPQRDGEEQGSFDDAAERLAIQRQMKEAKVAVVEICERVFASWSVDEYDKVHEHLRDAIRSIDKAAVLTVQRRRT